VLLGVCGWDSFVCFEALCAFYVYLEALALFDIYILLIKKKKKWPKNVYQLIKLRNTRTMARNPNRKTNSAVI
jgi:hypothetical protein